MDSILRTGASQGADAAAQAEFSEHHEAEVGNEAIVKGLVEMRKYWDALEGDFRVEETGAEGFDDEKKGRTHHLPNHGVHISDYLHDSSLTHLAGSALVISMVKAQQYQTRMVQLALGCIRVWCCCACNA